MPFNPATARPVTPEEFAGGAAPAVKVGKFNPATARPVTPEEFAGGAAARQVSEVSNTAPTDEGKSVGGFLSNVASSGAGFLGGVASAVMSPIDTAKGVIDLGAGALQNVLPKKVVDFVNSLDSPKGKKAAEDATVVADAIGGVYKERYGSLNKLKQTLYEDPVGAAADISTVLSLGGTAAAKLGAVKTGAALAKASTLTNPMVPVVKVAKQPFKLASKGVSAAYNALDPKSTLLAEAVEGRGSEIVNALRNSPEIVPGSKPTAAQAAAPAGATKFSALGKSAERVKPTEYFDRANAQKAAQLEAVRTVGKTPEALKAAEDLRSNTAKELYGISDKAVVSADAKLNTLMERPSMGKVVARAKELAAEKGVPFDMVPDEGGASIYSGNSLHSMKMAFDDMVKNPERFGMGANEVNAIKNTQGEFLKWVESKAPDYKVARETYAKQSKPINKMQVGQYLEGKLTPVLGEDTAKLRATGYASALDQAPSTIKKATTGQSRFDKLSQILEPDDLKILEDVRKDLSRSALAESQAAAGARSGISAGKAATDSMGGIRSPGMLNRVVTVANDIMHRLQGKLDSKLAIELATEMLEPDLAAVAIEKALARQARGAARGAVAKKLGSAVSNTMRNPVAVNAMIQANQNSLAEQ